MTDHPITVALRWVDRRFAVFPIALSWDEKKQSTNKRPLTVHGFRDASADPDLARDMFVSPPLPLLKGEQLGVGMVPGPAGYVVLDPDRKHYDDDGSLLDGVSYADQIGVPADTWTVPTAANGQHRYFRKPDPDQKIGNTVPPAWTDLLDVRADEGFVVAPGTTSRWGNWVETVPWDPALVRELPAHIHTMLTTATGGGAGSTWRRYRPEEHDPLLHPMTVEAHGLMVDKHAVNPTLTTFHTAPDRDPWLHVTRPGKSGGVSASVGFVGPGAVKVFSEAWPGLPAGIHEPLLEAWADDQEQTSQESGSSTRLDDWPEPVPLIVGSTTAFPVDALPEGMGAAVTEVADALLVDPALPATAFLGVAAGAVGVLTEVVVTPSWRRRANLYLAVVAASGDGKTPAIAPALEPLRTIEEKITADAEEARRKARVLLPVLRRHLDELQKSDGDSLYELLAVQTQIEEQETAIRREARLLVDDVTPERLAELMADNGGQMVAVNDEGSLFRHLLGLYAGTPNLDPFLKSWDANPLKVDRKGGNGRERTALTIPAPLLTMVAAVQPTTIEEIGKPAHRDLVERGVIGRVLVSWPQSTAGRRLMSGRAHDRLRRVDPWNAVILREHQRGVAVMPFTPAALEVFLAWHDQIEVGLPLGRVYADVREFAVKTRDSVARIAGLFARLDESSTVDEDHVARAIRLGDYYLHHAQAVVECWSTAPTQVARVLIAKLPGKVSESQGRLIFDTRTAQRLARANAETTIEALELLHRHGHVRPLEPNVGFGVPGRRIGKQAPVVELNPRCHAAVAPVSPGVTAVTDIRGGARGSEHNHSEVPPEARDTGDTDVTPSDTKVTTDQDGAA